MKEFKRKVQLKLILLSILLAISLLVNLELLEALGGGKNGRVVYTYYSTLVEALR